LLVQSKEWRSLDRSLRWAVGKPPLLVSKRWRSGDRRSLGRKIPLPNGEL
jgi:hypothetical protein